MLLSPANGEVGRTHIAETRAAMVFLEFLFIEGRFLRERGGAETNPRNAAWRCEPRSTIVTNHNPPDVVVREPTPPLTEFPIATVVTNSTVGGSKPDSLGAGGHAGEVIEGEAFRTGKQLPGTAANTESGTLRGGEPQVAVHVVGDRADIQRSPTDRTFPGKRQGPSLSITEVQTILGGNGNFTVVLSHATNHLTTADVFRKRVVPGDFWREQRGFDLGRGISVQCLPPRSFETGNAIVREGIDPSLAITGNL